MYETVITVVGTVITPVDRHRLADGTVVANFRVVSTQRRYDKATGGWVDGEKLYIDVKCWRDLAENAAASLDKSDPVMVSGRLYTRSYEQNGQRRWTVTLEAQSVGPDLAWCTAAVTRSRRRGASADGGAHTQDPEPAGDEPVAGAEGGRLDRGALVGVGPGGEG